MKVAGVSIEIQNRGARGNHNRAVWGRQSDKNALKERENKRDSVDVDHR